MAKIWIEPAKARATLDRQRELERALRSLYQDVNGIRNGLRYKISGREAIAARLREAAEQISREAESAKAMRTALEQVIRQYENTEKGNLDRVKAEKTSIRQSGIGGGVADGRGGDGNHSLKDWKDLIIGAFIPWDLLRPVGPITPFIPLLPSIIRDLFFPYSGGKSPDYKGDAKIDLEKKYKDSKSFEKFDKFKKDHTETLKDTKFYWDPKTGKKTPIDPNDENAKKEFAKHNKGTVPVDVTLAGIGTSGYIAGFALPEDTGFKGKYGGMEAELYISKLEGKAEAHAGWGYVGASLGATYTAFSAKEKAYLGSEDYNVYEEVKVEAGRVGAKAEARDGIVDKEGKFNPSIYAGAKAEAIAGEISGKAGVKLGGIDVAAEGSLNYGIGAHANVGFHDGKLSVDIGATLGVGGSVKLDIDVSGAVKAVGETAGKVWSGVKSWFGW